MQRLLVPLALALLALVLLLFALGVTFRGVATGPPGLEFDPDALDLGELQPGEERVVDVAWRRIGVGSLRLHALGTSCACLGATGIPLDVPEGAEGVLRARLLAPTQPGPLRFRVQAITDARRRGGRAITTLGVGAWVTRPLRAERAIDLGPCSPGRKVHRTLTVSMTRPLAEAGLAASLDGVAGRVVVRRPFIDGRALVDVDLELPILAGPLKGVVRLRSPPSPEGYVLDVPLQGEVVRAVASAPATAPRPLVTR